MKAVNIFRFVIVFTILGSSSLNCFAQDYIFGPEMDNWTESIKEQQRLNAQEFIQQLKDAKSNGASELVLKHEHYRFKKSFSDNPGVAHIYAKDLSNLIIDGNGAQFWFEDFHTALFFEDCDNVTLKDIIFDYDPVPQAQGVISQIGDNYLEITNEEGFLTCTELSAIAGETKSKVFVFEADTSLFKRDVPHMVVENFQDMGDNHTRIMVKAQGGYKLTGPPNIDIGDRVCINFHMGHGVIFEDCYNTTLDNFNMYASTQYGVVSRFGGGFKMINSSIIQRPGTKRLMTTNQDGIHFQSNEKGPHIENCKLSGMSDDVINVHGDFDMVQKQLAPNQGLISIRNYLLLEKGDTLNIYDVSNYSKKVTVKIMDIKKSTNSDDLSDAKAIGDEFNINFWVGKYSMIVTFDKDVNLTRGDVIENPSKGSYGTYIANNHVYNSSTRGIIVKARDAKVTGNLVENVAVSGILTLASLEWFDAVFPHNVEISNNTLLSVGYSLNSRGAGQNKLGAICSMIEYFGSLRTGMYNAKNIIIENNYIEDTPLAGIFAVHMDSGAIRDNTIKKYITSKTRDMGKQLGIEPFAAIYIAESKDVVIKDNIISDPGQYAEEEIRYGPNVFYSADMANVKLIVTANGNFIENAVVFFNALIQYTDVQGETEFTNVPVGNEYNLGINAPGFSSFNSTFTLENDTIIKIDIGEPTSAGNSKMSKGPVIYPNPVTDLIFINTVETGYIDISNVDGRILKNADINRGLNKINLSGLPKGILILKISSQNSHRYQKIIKN